MKDTIPNSTLFQKKDLTSTYVRCKDYLVSEELFDLKYHQELDMLVTTPQPLSDDLGAYYVSEEYISHTDTKKGLIPYLYQTVKQYALKQKVSLVSKLHVGKGSILDVGAGTGDFLATAKKAGWEVYGVEVNENARSIAEQKGIALETSLEGFSEQQFDVISLWHVLEHIQNLEETIAILERLLKPNGYLLIAVPNYKSFDASYYNEFWAAYDVPRHLWHFSQTSIPKLFPGFKLLQTRPMYFDSFYVSLLSEKYKHGVSFSIRAFFIGFWSNFRAIRSGEYSSLIYCLQKKV